MKTILTSSQKVVVLIILFFISVYLISNDSHPFLSCKSETPVAKKDSVVSWKVPELNSIPDNKQGEIIKLGRNIFVETYKYIGPDVADVSKRFTGNNMDCQNCHFNAGTQKNVLGLVGTYSEYPKMDARSGKEIDIMERINNCMTRSMNGKAMPVESKEMEALVAYMKWLSTDIPKGAKVEGSGLPKIQLLDRAADTSKGRVVFHNNCITCHAENGNGALNKPANAEVAADSVSGYDYPPVFGYQSYNDGAGLYRLLTATSFIYHKMPLNDAELTIEQSYDVAAFINSMPRPRKSDLAKDYPDLKLKPIDFPFPPFNDNFSEEQHRYGPYQKMIIEGEKSIMIKPE